ncbi:MAG: class I SAM-dependent methyltransferase [Terriglobales bacterium]
MIASTPSTGPTTTTAPVAAPDRNPASGWRNWLARQQRISEKWDRILLPAELWRDPFRDFRHNMVYPALGSAKVAYDVGGGRSPFIPAAMCAELDLTVTGLDISPEELAAGQYQWATVPDLSGGYVGSEDGDLAICHTVLEHVPDVRRAMASLASLLHPGGWAYVFVPRRTALLARLNRCLPEAPKRWLLDFLYPETLDRRGFRAYHDQCEPAGLAAAAQAAGFHVVASRAYFVSFYLYTCAPLHVPWRLAANLRRWLVGVNAAQYLALELEKSGGPAAGRQ